MKSAAHYAFRRPFVAAAAALLVAGAIGSGAVSAAGAISQSFATTDSNAIAGSIMDLRVSSQNTAELAADSRADQLLGIVASKPLIELGDGASQVQVVTSGLTAALVSDINGPVAMGDKITASPIAGIGMKATTSTTIVGTAQDKLDVANATTETVTDKQGNPHTVHIGSIPLQVNVTYYAARDDQLSAYVPSFMQAVSNSITGHTVSALRVVVGFTALLAGFLTVCVMLFSAIRSGVTAIGRNPMAGSSLRVGMVEIAVTALGILILTILLVYIVLAA